jgi:DNA-binding CsgD family transcriptional regulator/tetratricopeptide (TPR) repeat protein
MAFVGRERELAQLAGALQRVAEGRPGRVVLTGPAGIGSTRLLDELSRRLASVPDVIVARGAAVEPASGEPYQALIEALEAALDRVTEDRLPTAVGGSGHDLAQLVPVLSARLDRAGLAHDPPRLAAPDQLGSRMTEAVVGTFERLAGPGIVLLVLEDLHHADPATRGFIRSLLRIERPLPMCLVVTYRPDELHRRHPARDLAQALAADDATQRIDLGSLGPSELERIVAAQLGERPSGDLMAAALEGSHGNPLLCEQLVAAATVLEGIRLSDPFEQLVDARLHELSPPAARLVRLLATARQPLPRSTVLDLRHPEGRTTVAAITEAVGSGLIVEGPEAIVRIAHDLYGEAIEALDLPPERAALHAALAAALATRPARAAWHWECAQRPAEARAAHLAAAETSARVDPGETTLHHLLRALELGADDPSRSEDVASLMERAARAAASAGEFRRAAALIRRAIDHRAASRPTSPVGGRTGPAAHLADERRLALGALHEELGRFLWAGGDLEGGVRALEQALTLMPSSPSVERARALASLAQHLMLDGRFAESAALADDARRMAVAAGPEALRELGHATCTLGVDVAYQGRLADGLGLLQEAAHLARSAGRLDDLIRVDANLTTLLDLDARREEALSVVAEGIRDAEQGGLGGTYGAFLRGNAADILFQLGRWAESERECRAGMEWQPAGVAWFSPTLYLGLVLVESRADDEAAGLVGRTLLQLETVPAGQWTALVQRAAVSLALWRSDHADALAVAERDWPRVLATDDAAQIALAASTCLEAAAAAVDDGRLRRDWSLVAQAGELAERVLPEAEQRVARGSLAPGLGARAEADLQLAVARAHRRRVRGRPSSSAWAKIADAWMARSLPYPAAKARWWQALAILQAGGARDEARVALAEAAAIAAALPAGPLLAAVTDLATRARLALPEVGEAAERALVAMGPGLASDAGAGPDGGRGLAAQLVGIEVGSPAETYGLSPREQEVLRIVAEGRTDREIAERLFISERTVHVHVRNVLAKLGVTSRTQAASLALRQGLVPLTSGTPDAR